jgi:hypothetical protein
MFRFCHSLAALTAATLLQMTANAADWYVQPTGQDSTANNGGKSTGNPFKTLSYGFAQMNAGDTLYLMNGTYRNANYGNGNLMNPPALKLASSAATSLTSKSSA